MIVATARTFKTWRQGDDGFYFSPDNMKLVPRAQIRISQRCPENYRSLIQECMLHGWIKMEAHQPIQEHFIEELTK